MPKKAGLIRSTDRHSKNTLSRREMLHGAMKLFSAQGFGDTSMTDIAEAVGTTPGNLYQIFGSKRNMFISGVKEHVASELALVYEPLRTSESGRSAITALLENNVRLCSHRSAFCTCLFTLSSQGMKITESQELLLEGRRLAAKAVKARLLQSVKEGELSAETNTTAAAELCVAVLTGLTFRAKDGAAPGLLFRSITLFVNGLGFRTDSD